MMQRESRARPGRATGLALRRDPDGNASGRSTPLASQITAADPAPAAIGDPDRDLARRAAAGQRAPFEMLLRRHYDHMHRIAWRMTGSRQDAEDVVQDVCCALVERIGSYRGESTFSTWLFGIVVNACHDHRRRGSTLARIKDGLSVLVGLTRQPDGRDLYRRTWLASGLARLDPSLRETVVLVVGEGLTHAEAGAVLGIAEPTVSWRMHEARRRLGDDLGKGEA
ncbi:RNA polymerase sigma factor [uncultured Enterovirga sp.]|uniref:RNA polymerase sigma factor n=1 Tax=uncultured Enterovirga sp. TaxID=2026352 RepID=UPI0035C9B830